MGSLSVHVFWFQDFSPETKMQYKDHHSPFLSIKA